MVPVRITLENFMSYEQRQTFDFEGQTLWVLAGPNGAGKSTVFDAITFALYGRYRDGEQQHVTSLINHRADFFRIDFEFRVGARSYRVVRSCPRKGSSLWEAMELLEGRWQRIEGADSVRVSDDWSKRTIGLGYEAFVSSVMLLQGQSDKLLRAQPADRYDTLAELIELKPYQDLEARAQLRQKAEEQKLQSLDETLRMIPAASNELLAAAEREHEARQLVYQQAEHDVEQQVKIAEGAKRHAQLQKDREQLAQQLDRDRELLARSDEIQTGLARHRELSAVLGPLKRIATLRKQLAGDETRLRALEPEIEQLAVREQETSAAQRQKDSAVRQLSGQKSDCERELRGISDRLHELHPQVDRISQVESTETELRQLTERAAAFPADLKDQLHAAEQESSAIEEAARSHKALSAIFDQRKDLLEIEDETNGLRTELVKIRITSDGSSAEMAQLRQQQSSAQDRLREIERELAEYKAAHDNAANRLVQFETAAGNRHCDLCGQQIDENHAARERARLHEQRTTLEAAQREKKRDHDTVFAQRNQLEQQLAKLQEGEKESLLRVQSLESSEKEKARQSARFLRSLHKAVTELPDSLRDRIAVEIPLTAIDWRQTEFPRQNDLEILAKKAAEKSAHSQHRKQLANRFENYSLLSGQILQAQNKIASLLTGNQRDELLTARSEQQQQLADRENKRAQLAAIERSIAIANQELQRFIELCASLKQKHHALQQESIELRQRKTGWEGESRLLSEQLPPDWLARATGSLEEELPQLSAEHGRLGAFAREEKELALAQKRHAEIAAKLQELSRQIEATPEDERRAPDDVLAQLKSARTKKSEADDARQRALSSWRELEANRRKRAELEELRKQCDRRHQLAKRLAKLLGKDQLQRHVMSAAEREIVRIANQILSGLSRGRMQLSLRNDEATPATGKGKERQKALDLLFHNADTGQRPMDIKLASGSQAFRVAISLALAMGRYFGQDGRRVESVIIDEGFGCLDTTSREDTIEVLNALQQSMKRIILVSHQEEFAHEFRNGYAIRLEERASRITRIAD